MDINDFSQIAVRLRPRLIAEITAMLGDTVRAETPDDIVQETLIKLWTIRDRLSTESPLDSLASIIARRRCIDLMRSRHLPEPDFESAADRPDFTSLSALEAIIAKENELEGDAILSQLPPLQQSILRMRHIEGLEIDEISRITGSSPGAVRTNISRARHTVKLLFIKSNIS